MNLSIIIVSWNVKDYLLNCLGSIRDNCSDIDYEIIVVDNASSDGSSQVVKEKFPNITIIANDSNLGFGAANNQAVKIARGDYLFLLNPDTLVHSDSVQAMLNILREDPSIGLIGPKIVNYDGSLCPSTGRMPTFTEALLSKTILKNTGLFRKKLKKLKVDNFDYSRSGFVEQISGAAMLVRADVMKQLEGFDEDFFMYYEDTDLCCRILKSGFKIVYTPYSIITHTGGQSSKQISAKKQYLVCSSLLKFFKKHYGKGKTFLFSLIFKPALLLRHILNVFIAFLGLFFCIFNSYRIRKTASKLYNSFSFLFRYGIIFLFE